MMAPFKIEVLSKVLGIEQPAAPLETVVLEMLVEKISAAELIRRTVEEQVRELMVLRRLRAEEAGEILRRQYLTAAEIAGQAASGAVRYPSNKAGPAELDPEQEVRRAWRAFEAGSYSVYVDGRKVERLAEELTFAPGTRVIFLRLMPLRGG